MKDILEGVQRISLAMIFLLGVFIFTTHTVHAQEWYGDDWVRDNFFGGQGFNFDGNQNVVYYGHWNYIQEYTTSAGDRMVATYCSNGYYSYEVHYVCYSSQNVCGDSGTGDTGSWVAFSPYGIDGSSSWGCNASVPPESWYGTPPDSGDGNGFKVYSGMDRNIVNRAGYHFCATNKTGNSYFVPARTSNELANFLNASGRLGVSIHW